MKRGFSITDNLKGSECQALKTLSEDPYIVIKISDKDALVVIQDSRTYRDEVVRQLSAEHTYLKLKGNPTVRFRGNLTTPSVKG